MGESPPDVNLPDTMSGISVKCKGRFQGRSIRLF
jgi:hypothetical protein